jgi:hypothetical protein
VTEPTDRRRTAPDPWNIGFGAVTLTAALLALFVWFPNDIVGGFIEQNYAGKSEPGDAFFPFLLASALLVLSAVQLLGALVQRANRDRDAGIGKLTPANLKFLLLFYAIVVTGLTVMYWLGPLTTEALRAFGFIDQTYRQLVDTAPYKYLGYLAGGFLMTFGLITWAEGKVRPRAVFTVILVLAVSVLIFDILLNNIQLPPNADY